MIDVWDALEFAVVAHKDQPRKYTEEPYVVHPIRVGKAVKHLNNLTIASAFLHDVIEDTEVTYEDIKEYFGRPVADVVQELTDPHLSEGNRAKRKEITRRKMEQGSFEAKSIKCADILDNMDSILTNDENFSIVFMKEIQALLPCLEGADEHLLNKLKVRVGDYYHEQLQEALR